MNRPKKTGILDLLAYNKKLFDSRTVLGFGRYDVKKSTVVSKGCLLQSRIVALAHTGLCLVCVGA
jgi:hypothetical protein